MKKTVSLVLAVAAVFLMLAACGPSGSSRAEESSASGTFDPAQLKTMADVFVYEDPDEPNEAYTDTDYVFVFQVDGEYYRAVAQLPEEVSAALWEIDFFDEDRDQKVKDLISPLEVTVENLSEQIPGQEELDKLVGKTGQELFDDGWDYWYYNLEDMEAGMNYGPFSYVVRFAYDGEPMENTDDFDFYEEFKDLPVLSVTYDGIGDATNLE